MPNQCTVNIAGMIGSVEMLNNPGSAGSADAQPSPDTAASPELSANNAELQTQIEHYKNLCQNLQVAVSKLNNSFNKILTGQKEQIAKLSVEIAHKVIIQKINEKDYQIEAIIQNALENTSAKTDIILNLNPIDLADLQQKQNDGSFQMPEGISFVADANIGPAECIIESPKGIIKSLINSHLEEIQNALTSAV